MRKLLFLLVVGLAIFLLSRTEKGQVVTQVAKRYVVSPNYIEEQGNTVASRVKLPENYARVPYPAGSFQQYLRSFKLLPAGAEVINYTGKSYVYQRGHVGVLDLSVPDNGLQQCADALIRLRAEYLWQAGRKDEIGFNFTSGDYCSWKYYAQGYRPVINGNDVRFEKSASADHSKANFYRYLNLIFTYSGTQSLHDELIHITDPDEMQLGDMLVYPGFPGHIIMAVDEISNANGEKLFIFAQGNTPAQSVHMLKNLNDSKRSPWYEYPQGDSFGIPTYTFTEFKCIRFK